MEPKELAETIARIADDKQARDIEIFDLRGLCDITDFFVICTGGNARHVDSVVDEVENVLRPQGERAFAVEGRPDCEWLLMDFGQVVVHVFQPDARAYYRLERMWGDAPRADMDEDGALTWHPGRIKAASPAEGSGEAPAPEVPVEAVDGLIAESDE